MTVARPRERPQVLADAGLEWPLQTTNRINFAGVRWQHHHHPAPQRALMVTLAYVREGGMPKIARRHPRRAALTCASPLIQLANLPAPPGVKPINMGEGQGHASAEGEKNVDPFLISSAPWRGGLNSRCQSTPVRRAAADESCRCGVGFRCRGQLDLLRLLTMKNPQASKQRRPHRLKSANITTKRK